MKLYHFTCMLHLPSILREGITRGELPIDPNEPYDKSPQAANLTSNGRRNDQIRTWTEGTIVDKSRVRLQVDVPDGELMTFRTAKQKFGLREKWLKILDPYQERHGWFYAFGGVKPDQIVEVAVFETPEYRVKVGAELDELVSRIQAEIDRAFVLHDAGERAATLKEGIHESWLMDNLIPQEPIY